MWIMHLVFKKIHIYMTPYLLISDITWWSYIFCLVELHLRVLLLIFIHISRAVTLQVVSVALSIEIDYVVICLAVKNVDLQVLCLF
jgi:hypothetical protein